MNFLAPVRVSAEQEMFPFLGTVVEDGVNVRAGQSENFEKLGKMNANDRVIVVEKSYSWYKIELPIIFPCFISAKYIQELGSQTGLVVTNKVNVRAGANIQSTVLGQLDSGAKVHILRRDGDWYQVKAPAGVYGWIADKLVTFVSNDISPVVAQPVAEVLVAAREEKDLSLGQEQNISLKGKIIKLGNFPQEQIRFQFQAADQKVYYLYGFQHVLGDFSGMTVKVNGKLLGQNFGPTVTLPVIVVQRVELVL